MPHATVHRVSLRAYSAHESSRHDACWASTRLYCVMIVAHVCSVESRATRTDQQPLRSWSRALWYAREPAWMAAVSGNRTPGRRPKGTRHADAGTVARNRETGCRERVSASLDDRFERFGFGFKRTSASINPVHFRAPPIISGCRSVVKRISRCCATCRSPPRGGIRKRRSSKTSHGQEFLKISAATFYANGVRRRECHPMTLPRA